MIKKTNSIYRIIIFIGTCLVLMLPIALYFITFNNGLSNDSQKWGAFGSFIGGVYAPIAAIISIYVLIVTLKEMQLNNKVNLETQNRVRILENIRWLADLLRKTLDKNSVYGTNQIGFYNELTNKVYESNKMISSVSIEVIKNDAVRLMKYNVKLYENEIAIFDELFFRVTDIDYEDEYALAVMIVMGNLSSEERFWLMQYAKAHNKSAAKWLKKWPGFEELPISMKRLVRSY